MNDIFVRSPSGTKNFSLILGVDVIIYCEGGDSLKSDDINSGLYNKSAEDQVFWEQIFSVMHPDVNVYMRPIGGCENVKRMADLLVSGKRSGFLVAMDADWNRVCGTAYEHQKVMYTYGYAWENDVVNPKTVAETIVAINRLSKKEVARHSAEFLKVLNDLYVSSKGNLIVQLTCHGSGASFYPTDPGLGGAIKHDSERVYIDRDVLRRIIISKKSTYKKKRKINAKSLDVHNLIPGHVLMGIATKFTKLVAAKEGHGIRPGDKDIISMLLTQFKNELLVPTDKEKCDYYRNVIQRCLSSQEDKP